MQHRDGSGHVVPWLEDDSEYAGKLHRAYLAALQVTTETNSTHDRGMLLYSRAAQACPGGHGMHAIQSEHVRLRVLRECMTSAGQRAPLGLRNGQKLTDNQKQ